MNAIQARRYEMLVRVRDFGDVHADLFPASSLGRQTFSTVAEVVAQLNAHTLSKVSSVQGTTAKANARAALSERLAAISQTARVIAEQTPGLEERFLLPDTPSDLALLTTGRVFSHDAALLEEQFVAHAMPKTFLADLRDALGRFEQAIHDRDAGRNERAAARASIEVAVTSGISAVRALDAMITNRLLHDPATLAAWKRARRVQYPNRPRPAAATPAPEPVPSAAGGTSSAGPAVGSAVAPVTSTPPPTVATSIAEVAS